MGSVASGSTDRYSDVDLLVCCSKHTGQVFMRRLNALRPIALYCPFEDLGTLLRHYQKHLKRAARDGSHATRDHEVGADHANSPEGSCARKLLGAATCAFFGD